MKNKIKSFLKRIIIDVLGTEDLSQLIRNSQIARCLSYVTIGEESLFYPEATVQNLSEDKSKISIGRNSHIRGELTIWPYSQGIQIGDNCFLGINSMIRSGEKIIIGNNVLISHNVTIIDSDSHEINARERTESFISMIKTGHPKKVGNVKTKAIIIKDNVWISFNVAILKGVTIGEGAIIAAGTVITKDVPAFNVVAGNPFKIIRTLE